MASDAEFPSASARETIVFCWNQIGRHRRQLVVSWVFIALAVLDADLVCPLIFASVLSRVASLPAHGHASEGHTFASLLVAYALAGLVSVGLWRIAGWNQWGSSLRSFSQGTTNGYRHLLTLSYRWHMDHPAGEVISALGNFSWAFVDMIDSFSWGLLPVAMVLLAALGVLAVVAWPAALALLVMVGGFVWVMARRLPLVRAASQEFEDFHSQATGVVADTVTNLMAVRTAAAEPRERQRVDDLMDQSVRADLRARSIFMRTQLQLESSIVVGTFLALLAGSWMAVHHWASTAIVYLILYYAAQVALQLQQSFESLRNFTRCLGRAAKFTAISEVAPEVVDADDARALVVSSGRVSFSDVRFSYRSTSELFAGLTLEVEPGEHVALVGPSGSGKSTLSKLLLRFMDIENGTIAVDGQDIRSVTLSSLRQGISYVPQDPQLLHRTIAENICYGLAAPSDADGRLGPVLDPDLVAEVGRAAHVEEFIQDLPDRYDTLVGERGLKLSGGQRQRVAIAQAMAKRAPILVLDEATSALDSESEHLVQEALWRLMENTTAVVIAHRLSTIARMDRIIVLEQGRIVQEGSHQALLAEGPEGLYGRLWRHQSGGFLVD
jgi:ATP-binding cassette subfamily B protein